MRFRVWFTHWHDPPLLYPTRQVPGTQRLGRLGLKGEKEDLREVGVDRKKLGS